MTLYELVTDAGMVLSFGLLVALLTLSPGGRSQISLCFKKHTNEDCLAECLRTCPLVAPHLTVMEAPAFAL